MNNINAFKAARLLYYSGCLTLCQLTIRPLFSFTLSDWFFLVSLLAVFIELILFNRKIELRLPSLFLLACLIFIVGGLISLINMNDKWIGLTVILRFIYLTIVWFWLGTMVLRTENHIRQALVLWLISAAVTGSAAVLQLLDPQIIPGTKTFIGRMVGFTGHPNDLGALSAISWGAAIALLLTGKSISKSLLKYWIVIAILAGLILSGSMGSALAALSATVFWLFQSKNLNRWLMIMFTTICIITPILTIQHLQGGHSIIHRLNKTVYSSSGQTTLNMRTQTYIQAFDEIIQNRLIGAGMEPGGTKTKTGGIVHNAYLEALYEAGLLGLIGILLLTIATLITVKRLLLLTKDLRTERHLIIALSAGSIAFFVYSLTAPVLYQRYGWIALSLIFSMHALIKRNIKYGIITA